VQMAPRAFLGRAIAAAALLVVATTSAAALAAESQRPNILFVFTDDQPQICMGCMGNKLIQTPNMDRLAADGVLFTNAFVTTAICCSNRACILTGQHMRRHAVRDFRTPLSAEVFAQTYEQLFDLKDDPREEQNLVGDPDHVKTLIRLRKRCDEYRQSLK